MAQNKKKTKTDVRQIKVSAGNEAAKRSCPLKKQFNCKLAITEKLTSNLCLGLLLEDSVFLFLAYTCHSYIFQLASYLACCYSCLGFSEG